MSNETDVVMEIPRLADLLEKVEADLAQPAPALQAAEASGPDVAPAAGGEPALTFDAAMASIGAGPDVEPAAGPLGPMPAAPPPGSPEAERQRAAEIALLGQQAARLGVHLDLRESIASGADVESLRKGVLTQAAHRASETVLITTPPAESAFRAGPPVERQSPIVDLARRQRETFDRERGGR